MTISLHILFAILIVPRLVVQLVIVGIALPIVFLTEWLDHRRSKRASATARRDAADVYLDAHQASDSLKEAWIAQSGPVDCGGGDCGGIELF